MPRASEGEPAREEGVDGPGEGGGHEHRLRAHHRLLHVCVRVCVRARASGEEEEEAGPKRRETRR